MLPNTDQEFAFLVIELYGAILEEMGYPESFASVVKDNLLRELKDNPKTFMPSRASKKTRSQKVEANSPPVARNVEPTQ